MVAEIGSLISMVNVLTISQYEPKMKRIRVTTEAGGCE